MKKYWWILHQLYPVFQPPESWYFEWKTCLVKQKWPPLHCKKLFGKSPDGHQKLPFENLNYLWTWKQSLGLTNLTLSYVKSRPSPDVIFPSFSRAELTHKRYTISILLYKFSVNKVLTIQNMLQHSMFEGFKESNEQWEISSTVP